MEFREVMMAFLMMLPAGVIGFVGGVLVMRGNYLPRIRWYQKQIGKMQRRMVRQEAPTPWVG